VPDLFLGAKNTDSGKVYLPCLL